jgi:hypothetical protein
MLEQLQESLCILPYYRNHDLSGEKKWYTTIFVIRSPNITVLYFEFLASQK